MNIDKHYEELKKLAIRHRKLTGNSIPGLTGELGEWYTAKLLNLELTSEQNTPGYDALSKSGLKFQIKTSTPKKQTGNAWSYSHVCAKHNWNYIVFCFMTEYYEIICLVRMTKNQLRKVQTQSDKKHNRISGNTVIDIGVMLYSNKKLYNKYMPKTKERIYSYDTRTKNGLIKKLVREGITDTTIIIHELEENNYDTSNVKSIRSMISKAKVDIKLEYRKQIICNNIGN